MLFSTYSQTIKSVTSSGYVVTLRGPFLVSRTGDDTLLPPPRMWIQNASAEKIVQAVQITQYNEGLTWSCV